jgi:hypothetical protein
MSFYVVPSELAKLSGRSRQAIDKCRSSKRIPSALSEKGDFIYDVDDPGVKAIFQSFPKGTSELIKVQAAAYQKEFARKRREGTIKCVMSGMADLMDDMMDFGDVILSADDESLDREKKEKDIEYRGKQIEKLEVTLTAMKGGLIERAFVTTWVERYLGTLHTQHLELATNGICEDLYSDAHRLKDSRAAIKEMEKRLAEALSDVLKGAIAAMEKNRI